MAPTASVTAVSDEAGGEAPRVVLVRHGETEWSLQRKHTGRTDIPLDDDGRRRAVALRPMLAGLPGIDAAQVLTSPLQRARQTAELAGLGDRAVVCDDLLEWDYGVLRGSPHERHPQGHPRLVRLDASGHRWRDGRPGRRARRSHDRPRRGPSGPDGDVRPRPRAAHPRRPLVRPATVRGKHPDARTGERLDPRPRARGPRHRALEPHPRDLFTGPSGPAATIVDGDR